ncbi:MAG: M3 family metallopeptidase, partial [Chthoniobacterales bacterium]
MDVSTLIVCHACRVAALQQHHTSLVLMHKSLPVSTVRLVITCTAVLLASPMHAQQKSSTAPAESPAASENPLLVQSTLPYQLPPFDKIKNQHFAPAYTTSLAEHMKEIQAIANSSEAPTFENTITAMERSGVALTRVNNIFGNLAGAHTNPEIQKVETEVSPKLAAHQDEIFLNAKLFARVQSLYEKRAELSDAESKYLLERYYKDFVRAGAKLSEPDKKKLKAINGELASLETKFSQDVLKEKNAAAIVVDDRSDLAGMAENEIAAAAKAAEEDKKKGKFLIAMQNTSGQPALSSLENRALRERIMKTSLARNSHGGEFDTRESVSRIARLRAERAQLLGFENHATYQLTDQTAGSVATVNKLLSELAPPAVANAKKEAADLQSMIKKEGGDFPVESWDWSFYSEKVMKDRYAFDEGQLRPYFEMNRVIKDGVFFAAGQLYGLTFKERKDLPVYQEDVRVFEVFDKDEKPLALFLLDYYARPSKRGGAWMNEYVNQSDLLGM